MAVTFAIGQEGDFFLLEPSGCDEHHAACCNLTDKGDQAPRVEVKPEQRAPKAFVAGENVRATLPASTPPHRPAAMMVMPFQWQPLAMGKYTVAGMQQDVQRTEHTQHQGDALHDAERQGNSPAIDWTAKAAAGSAPGPTR